MMAIYRKYPVGTRLFVGLTLSFLFLFLSLAQSVFPALYAAISQGLTFMSENWSLTNNTAAAIFPSHTVAATAAAIILTPVAVWILCHVLTISLNLLARLVVWFDGWGR